MRSWFNNEKIKLDDFLNSIDPNTLDSIPASKVTGEGKNLIHGITESIQ